jgi:hypothetical protein
MLSLYSMMRRIRYTFGVFSGRQPRRIASALLLVACYGCRAWCQSAPAREVRTAKVVVIAVDGFGNRLDDTKVDSFVDENGHNLVALFPHDRATKVPFGRYRISVQATVDFAEATFDVDINSANVVITAALEWYGIENVKVTGRLSGNLAGYPKNLHDGWCKASGLYSRMQYESPLVGPGLAFDFGWIPAGIYTLTCVADSKVIVLRPVRVNGGTKPLTIALKPSDDLGTIE